MALTAGTRLGPYEVIAPLGAGGMGEVYRARDTKLDRDVAIKVLPEGFAGDRDRFVRFQREARVLASLNHPQIAQIHGFEDASGTPALVMELVDGPTLADRLAAARLPQEETLTIARQIAEPLEAAHAQGIVHRDLKPANVKVRDDGTVKVLDFGLAKAIDPPSGTPGASVSPTLSLHATQAGIILGTAAYMAPEQARGKAADTRADIWSFGVVLFEMLAGTRPFPGDDISDTLAGILKSEPPWDALPRDTPAAIRRLLRRCLQKDRQQRLQHIGDARLEIDEARGATAGEPAAAAETVRRPFLWIAAAAATALAVGIIAGRQFSIVPEPPEMRLEITNHAGNVTHFALSPDGRSIVYARSGRRGLQVRAFHDSAWRTLTGTEGAEYSFWSADGRSLGFFANNRLLRVESDGGAPQELATVITPGGGAWNRDGVILYVPNDSGGVFRVPAGGGESRMVTPQRTPPLATRLPQFLPDGRRFLFYVARGGEPAGVYVGELGSDSIQRILSTNAPAVYGSGHLWFIRDGALVAQAFEPASLALSGPIMHVADEVRGGGPLGYAVSASVAGPIAYRTSLGLASSLLLRQLVWFDRSGKRTGTAGEPGALASNPTLSPDGRSLLLQRTVQDNIDLWLIDLQRNVSSRLTENPGVDSMPVWSADNNRVIFNTQSIGEIGLAIATLDKTRPQERVPLPFDDGVKVTSDWSTDGHFILYTHFNQSPATTDVWALPMQGDRKPVPVATMRYNERDAQFSPDGKWVAYESDEAGSPEIYLQPFPGTGAKQRVSVAGGTQVRWRRDGRELYYIAADETLTAVAIDTTAVSSVGTTARLFKTNISPVRSISRQQYVVSRDGKSFLILTDEEGPVAPVTLLFNWKPPATSTR